MSPLLFLIFFADAVKAIDRAHLDQGTIMLVGLSLSAILCADDVVFFARSLLDLEKLLDAFSYFVRIFMKILL